MQEVEDVLLSNIEVDDVDVDIRLEDEVEVELHVVLLRPCPEALTVPHRNWPRLSHPGWLRVAC